MFYNHQQCYDLCPQTCLSVKATLSGALKAHDTIYFQWLVTLLNMKYLFSSLNSFLSDSVFSLWIIFCLTASLVAQLVKNPPAMQKTWVKFLGWEDLLEKGMATHSSILSWEIPWLEKPGGLQSMGPQSLTRLSDFFLPPGASAPCPRAAPPPPARRERSGYISHPKPEIQIKGVGREQNKG